MAIRRLMTGALAAVVLVGLPVSASSAQLPERITAYSDPAVHVSPDHVVELRLYLTSCTNALACTAPVGLYGRAGRRLTSTANAGLIPTPGGGEAFAAVRLLAGTWRTLQRTHRIIARVVVHFPDASTQLLGFETLLPPAPGQKRYCAGPPRSFGPPCRPSPIQS